MFIIPKTQKKFCLKNWQMKGYDDHDKKGVTVSCTIYSFCLQINLSFCQITFVLHMIFKHLPSHPSSLYMFLWSQKRNSSMKKQYLEKRWQNKSHKFVFISLWITEPVLSPFNYLGHITIVEYTKTNPIPLFGLHYCTLTNILMSCTFENEAILFMIAEARTARNM
jgi:hypothetical protein